MLNAPNSATSYVWSAASIPAGTSVIFAMSDAQNRTGGVSGILVSGFTGNASCLNANSPSVTLQSTPLTQTSLSPSSSSSSSAQSSASSKSSKISGMTLFAVIAGTLVFLGVIVALGVFLLRRCRKRSSHQRRANFDVDGKLSKLSAVPLLTLAQVVIRTLLHLHPCAKGWNPFLHPLLLLHRHTR